MECFQKLQTEIKKLQDKETERSFYPILKDFFIEAGRETATIKQEINVIAEASSKLHESKVGFPDLTVQLKQNFFRSIGWVEVKLPKDNLNDAKFQAQFERYRNSLENVIFTNLREWELWQWDKNGKSVQVGTALFDAVNYQPGTEKAIIDLLNKFYNGKALEIKTPKQLALALARKTRLLSQQVEDHIVTAIESGDENNDLMSLRDAFSKTLISDMEPHQFANMVAETLAYSLFLAALEHDRRTQGSTAPDNTFTLTTAIDYLPKSVPILSSLYSLTSNVSRDIPEIHYAVESLIEQLNSSDIYGIHEKMLHHKQGDDPVIHFYEPFLAEYDPKEREARGVYYTPRPVVDYIVRSVDWILKEKLGKKAGLADPEVHLLDPATGTGTFLMSAIEQIHAQKEKQFGPLGDEIVQKEFCRTVQGHILKHFYGFELMVAPYAIAHLKLTMLLEQYGFDFDMTRDNADTDDDRLKIYLTNSLEEPEKNEDEGSQMTMFSFMKRISEENRAASKVKSSTPVVAIIGNPPYSGISQNPVEKVIVENGKKRKVKTWIGDLIEDYKYVEGDRHTGKHFGERKHWLGDDYVKFIRLAQWKIHQLGEGVVAMITNNGFLDNPTFRGMRYQLMQDFDEIYCLNLHGSSTKKETAPDGSKDENVFNIQTGVGITLFVKTKEKQPCKVFYADIYGLREEKFEFLKKTNLQDTPWKDLNVTKPYYFFMDKDFGGYEEEYEKGWKINEIFLVNVTGIVTARDDLVIDFSKKKLLERIIDFCDPNKTDEQISAKYFGKKKAGKYRPGDSRGWKMSEARKVIAAENHEKNIVDILYRPFDTRFIYYHPKMVDWGREKIMRNFLVGKNFGLVSARSNKKDKKDHFFVSGAITEAKTGESSTQSMVFPLYLFDVAAQSGFSENQGNASNIAPEFVALIVEKVGLNFLISGRGDLSKTFGPEDVFYYAYAVFHSPTYRTRYAEQLKIDFPRLPLTGNKELFVKLVRLGNELVNLHLLGENPFDASRTIFDDPQKWGVKIGGTKPENVEDWKVAEVRYEADTGRVYVNSGQYFEGIEKAVWKFMVGGYQVCEKWLKDRKKAGRSLSVDDLQHYMKIVVSLRETVRLMKEIDAAIPGWPIK